MPDTKIVQSTMISGKMQNVTVNVTTKLGFDTKSEKAIVAACLAGDFHKSKKYRGKLPADMIGYVHATDNSLYLVTAFSQTSETPPIFSITIPKEGKVNAGFHCF